MTTLGNPEQADFGDPWNRTDFPSASVKYRALVKGFRSDLPLRTTLSNYTETDALSAIEAEIFDIDPALVADLFWAYERYLNLIGIVDAYFDEHREQERIDYARFFHGECVISMDEAVDFMVEACGLSATQCFGWVLKVAASQLRGGLYGDKDDGDGGEGANGTIER